MSINSYIDEEGKTKWKVYINIYSPSDRRIRMQRIERGLESKGKALRRENELKEICYREIIRREGLLPTWGEIVLEWEKFRRSVGDIQEDTVDDYVQALRDWTKPIWDRQCNEITKGDTRAIIDHLKEEGLSNSFQKKVLNGIKRVYVWGREEGKIKGGLDNITSGIKVSRFEEKTPEILSFEQLCYLLEQAKKENHPWYPIWMAAVMTGCRNSELLALEWSEIDFSKNLILLSKSFNRKKDAFKSLKSGYFRTVPINEALREVFLELRSKSTDNFVLPRVRSWLMGLQARELRRFCVRIGIPSVKFHTLRACFATHLLSNGVSIGQVQKIAGWVELETMQRYIRLSGISVQGQTACLDGLAPKIDLPEVVSISSFMNKKDETAFVNFSSEAGQEANLL